MMLYEASEMRAIFEWVKEQLKHWLLAVVSSEVKSLKIAIEGMKHVTYHHWRNGTTIVAYCARTPNNIRVASRAVVDIETKKNRHDKVRKKFDNMHDNDS